MIAFHPMRWSADIHMSDFIAARLVTRDGYAVGTIAVMDSTPRTMKEDDLLTIRRLARQTAALLELRMLRSERFSVDPLSTDDPGGDLTEAAFVVDCSGDSSG